MNSLSNKLSPSPLVNCHEFIESQKQGPIGITITQEVWLSASCLKNKRSSAMLLTPKEKLDSKAIIKLINQCAQSLESSEEELKWKIVGNTAFAQKVLEMIKPFVPTFQNQIIRNDPIEIWFWPSTGKLIASRPTNKQISKIAKVLIVDDSKTIRNLLSSILKEDPGIEVVALAERPGQVEDLIKKHRPNVITLDIHMPEMDGVSLLKKIFPIYRIPTIMISSLSQEEGPEVLNALEAGAFDYIKKPGANELKEIAPIICEKIKAAVSAKCLSTATSSSATSNNVINRQETSLSPEVLPQRDFDLNKIITIGSSTGGTEALRVLLTTLPKKVPPILIAQHIPPVFSAALSRRLNELCTIEVREAKDGDVLMPGLALIAPGGLQMTLHKNASSSYYVRVSNLEQESRYRPSVDVLFDSVAKEAGTNSIGIILTGMGSDGSKGMLNLKKQGAKTIAQDEASCVVFGMPKKAIELGAADKILSLDKISTYLLDSLEIPNKENVS